MVNSHWIEGRVPLALISSSARLPMPAGNIYTDIKGACPSVPYQAFADALTSLGLGNGFLDLIINMQTDFTCTAKGPTGYSSAKPKANGVHEGDCTLFCLVLNMYFRWVQSADLGYEMLSAKHSSRALRVTVLVNGYADDMALIGNSHDEAQKILTMLERFLSYYGMSLNAGKCGYQYRPENPLYRPPPAFSRWGSIPTHHGSSSYKYLGYFINMRPDFKYQFESMVQKLNDACVAY
jgi:hypothetical protein